MPSRKRRAEYPADWTPTIRTWDTDLEPRWGSCEGNSWRARLNWTVLDRNRLPSARQIEVFWWTVSFATMRSSVRARLAPPNFRTLPAVPGPFPNRSGIMQVKTLKVSF